MTKLEELRVALEATIAVEVAAEAAAVAAEAATDDAWIAYEEELKKQKENNE